MSKNVATFELGMDNKYLSKSKAKEFKGLSLKKERDASGLFLIEGEKCVEDTIGSFEVVNLICRPEWLVSHSNYAKTYGEKILISDKRGLEIISSFTSVPDVIAVCRKLKDEDVFILDEKKLYLLLDEIQDPGNLGTIIRTCDWFGVYDIFASKNTVDVYSPKVIQASMGSLSRVHVHYVDLKNLIVSNKKIKLIGAVLNGRSIEELSSLTGLLLMGNEGRGISRELMELIDFPVTIPPVNPHSHPDSLNVAISTAIILSHITS